MQWLRNAAYILMVILGGGFLLLAGKDLLFPFLFAIFFCFLLMPLEKRIFKWLPYKLVSITSSVLVVLGIIGGMGFVFGYQLVQIISEMNSVQDSLKNGLKEILEFMEQKFPFLNMHSDEESTNQMLNKLLDAPVAYVGAGITSGAGLLFNIALTLIYMIFLLIYKDAFRDFLMIQFSKDKRDEIEAILTESVHLIQRYLTGMVTVVLILAVMNCTGLLLIGIDHAIFWGVLAACLVIIPFIGTALGGLLPFLYALTTSEHGWQPWAVVILFVFTVQLEANFITPKVVGSSVRINPLFALMGIVIMGSLMGIGGVVLAIPVMAILKLVAEGIDVLKPVALLMDKDLMQKRHLFYGKYDREDYRLSSLMQEEDTKR
ncbi:MAG: AI-2E family transporter [Saprospiraceae bacterium]|nr:AI-2E family transporter [Saprospiraceae bacterium]